VIGGVYFGASASVDETQGSAGVYVVGPSASASSVYALNLEASATQATTRTL
jgi:hypothetical protein